MIHCELHLQMVTRLVDLSTSVVVKQMDLVDDDESDELRVSLFTALPRDNVPFLRSADDDLCCLKKFESYLGPRRNF